MGMRMAGAMLAGWALAAACPASGQVTTPIVRTGTSVTGQPLRVPPAPFELVVNRVEIPAGGIIPTHKHPWSRYVYVEAGAIRVTNHDTGTVNDFSAGQVIVEAIGARAASHSDRHPPLGRWTEGTGVLDNEAA